jgi:hypothetical protein
MTLLEFKLQLVLYSPEILEEKNHNHSHTMRQSFACLGSTDIPVRGIRQDTDRNVCATSRTCLAVLIPLLPACGSAFGD